MDFAVFPGELEIRQRGGGRSLFGSFPYRSQATIRDRGRVRKERFEPGSFNFALNDEAREISVLAGHDFDRPLGSRLQGSAVFTDTAGALTFEVSLPAEGRQPSWVRDTMLAVEAGLVRGISPGFVIPPRHVVPDAERLIPEPGNPGVEIRVINAAVLREMSIVTRPAYPDTSAELRADEWPTARRRIWL